MKRFTIYNLQVKQSYEKRDFTRSVRLGDAISSRASGTSPSSTAGFTLVETLVALSIFTFSIIGLISMTASGINNTNYAKNKVTAAWLASEGVEMVRNIRDTTVLGSATGWSEFLSGPIATCMPANGSGCMIDAKNLAVSVCGGSAIGGCDPLRRTSTGSAVRYFDYSGSEVTGFTRTIVVTQLSPDEIQIDSTVSWPQGTGPDKEVSVRENLFNWYTSPTP